MEKLIGNNDKFDFYNWVDATDWVRMQRGQLKAYNWHVMIVRNKIGELQDICLMDSKTNNLIHNFDSISIDGVCAEIDMIKIKISY